MATRLASRLPALRANAPTAAKVVASALAQLEAASQGRDELREPLQAVAQDLRRLAEQVQPHFLFNVLNLISSVMYEDVARADRLLCELATLLRQSLSAQQAGEHSLAEELALVRPFLTLMQARFGEQRLQVQIDAEEGALAVRMPALLLLALALAAWLRPWRSNSAASAPSRSTSSRRPACRPAWPATDPWAPALPGRCG